MKRIVDLKGAGDYEILRGDSRGSGCRLGARRRGWGSGGGWADGGCDVLLGAGDEQRA